MGIIYILTFPSGKSYIGQTKFTFEKRFKEHIYDTFDEKKNHCRLLNKAIKKYGIENIKKEILCELSNELLNEQEEKFITQYNTIKPNGYNLKSGGLCNYHNQETKDKIREKLIGKPKKFESLLKRSQTKKENKSLPMYIIEIKKNDNVVGYRVSNPKLPEKRFQDMKQTLEEKLIKAKNYLNSMDAVQRLNDNG